MKREHVAVGVYRTGPRSYQVTYRVNGKQVWRGGFRSREEAIRYRKRILADIDRGLRLGPSNTTVAEFSVEWLAMMPLRLATNTVEGYSGAYRNHIGPAIGGKRVEDVTTADCMRILAGCSRGMVGTVRAAMGNLFNDAITHGLIAVSPTVTVPKKWRAPTPKRSRVLTREQLADYVAIAPAQLAFLALTGARIGEVALMEWSDVHPDGWHVLRGSRDGRTKTPESVRVVPLTPYLANLLGEPGEGRVWPWGAYHCGRMHRQVCDALGIEGVTPHGLRATVGTLMVQDGVDPLTVSRLLGHRSVRTTLDVYVRGDVTDRGAALAAFNDSVTSERRALTG